MEVSGAFVFAVLPKNGSYQLIRAAPVRALARKSLERWAK
jgi:hypothetical protein